MSTKNKKIAKVMREFKKRKLKSSSSGKRSSKRVKSRKQAIAIALSSPRKKK